jgi:HKD family nuclease
MKKNGLDFNRWIEPIEDFVREHGHQTPRWAVFLTYEFAPARFCRSVMPTLSRKGRCFRTIVLADQGALEKNLLQSRPELTGALNLHPVHCCTGGVFHPKLAFLRAGRSMRACFGSANLTNGGLGSNLELWSFTESPEVLRGIIHFLDALKKSPALVLGCGAHRSLHYALADFVGAKTASVWSSLQGTFADQIKTGPESKAGEVNVISPMFTGNGGARVARAAIPCPDFNLYTDDLANVPNCKEVFYYHPDPAAGGDEDTDAGPAELHAKAYVFHPRSKGTTWAWFGSANFTARALTTPIAKGGNVELMVRACLPDDEANALRADLKELFNESKPENNEEKPKEAPPKPCATILDCELRGRPGRWKLAIQAMPHTDHVDLQQDKQKVRVRIRKGWGFVEGQKLVSLIPQLADLADPEAAQVLVLFQVLKDRKVPIVVNIPHVPPSGGEGGNPQAQLDWIIDELLGRVPSVRPDSGSGEAEEQSGPDDRAKVESNSEDIDFERRLDLVQRQGELDQLAVKAALLKKLICRNRSAEERGRLLREYADTILAATPTHLKSVIREHFGI